MNFLFLLTPIYVPHFHITSVCSSFSHHQCMFLISTSPVYFPHFHITSICSTFSHHQCMFLIFTSPVYFPHFHITSICASFSHRRHHHQVPCQQTWVIMLLHIFSSPNCVIVCADSFPCHGKRL